MNEAAAELECITDISLVATDSSKRPPDTFPQGHLGYWDVDDGGSKGTDGNTGSYMMGMSVNKGAPEALKDCIEDVKLIASDSAPPPPPQGYDKVGHWDVDDGGSEGTDGSTGSYMMGLYVKRAEPDAGRDKPMVVDILLTASDSHNRAPTPTEYTPVGHWDVDDGGGHGTRETNGSYMMTMHVKKDALERADGRYACIIDLVLWASDSSGPYQEDVDGYDLVGFWDVDEGGSRGGSVRGGHASEVSEGEYIMSLYAKRESVDDIGKCVGGIYLVASDSDKEPAGELGDVLVGYWDVDGGGSRGTDGNTGSYMMALYAKPTVENDVQPLRGIALLASDEPDLSGRNHKGYEFIGQWDVDNGGGQGADGTSGGWMMAMFADVGKIDWHMSDTRLDYEMDDFRRLLGDDSNYVVVGHVDSQKYENRSDAEITRTFSIEEFTAETFRLGFQQTLHVGYEHSLEAGVPGLAATTVKWDLDFTAGVSEEKETTKTKTIKEAIHIKVPPQKLIQVTGTIERLKDVEIPFTMTSTLCGAVVGKATRRESEGEQQAAAAEGDDGCGTKGARRLDGETIVRMLSRQGFDGKILEVREDAVVVSLNGSLKGEFGSRTNVVAKQLMDYATGDDMERNIEVEFSRVPEQ